MLNGSPESVEAVTAWREQLYQKGRPVWGPALYDLQTLAAIRQAVLEAAAPVREIGGVLLLPYQPEAEASLLHLLTLLAGKFRWQRQAVAFSQFLAEPYLLLPAAPVSYWFIHQAPLFQNLTLALEAWLRPGRLAVLTGPAGYWEAQPPQVPYVTIAALHDYVEPVEGLLAEFAREEKATLQDVAQSLAASSQDLLRQAHHWVALADAWGVPLPLELLARLLDADEDLLGEVIEDAFQRDILFWVEREKPPALLVASRGVNYARGYLQQQAAAPDLSLSSYQPLFTACQPKEQEERYALLKLVESWLAQDRCRHALGPGFHITQVRALITHNWRRLQGLIRAGSAAEALIWGQCLAQLGLYEQGNQVLTTALGQDARNPYLRQAQAHLLARWSQTDPRQEEAAAQAFAAACQVAPHNVYLWQARGVFEAERRNRREAEVCFARALSLDPGNIPTLTARADLYLELGEWEQAWQDIQRAQELAPQNVYTLHLLGRYHFCQGAWDQAQTAWQQLLALEKHNLFALQSLGHMARQRGQWTAAAAALEQAVALAPENVPVLHELALLALERQDAPALPQADLYLEQALAVAPGNPKLLLTRANLRLQQGQADQARDLARQVLNRWPASLPALHLLSRAYLALDQQAEAVSAFQSIINLSYGRNLHVYLTWADWARQQGDQTTAQRLLQTALGVYRDYHQGWPASQRFQALVDLARLAGDLGLAAEAAAAREQAGQIDAAHPALAALRQPHDVR